MANPVIKAGAKLLVKGGKALRNRLNKPKIIKPGETSKARKAGKFAGVTIAYVAAEEGLSAGYNKFKNRNKNQSVNSTDNMSTSGPIDRSIEKNI
tara:strand:+ start:323 stop:607 length:285 start_codon:yes stop_codon:yes gene_type:complete